MASAYPAEARRIYFTAESANKALPLVRAIVLDIVHQWQVVSELERSLAPFLSEQNRAVPHELYSEELSHRQSQLESEQIRLKELLQELSELGVEIKSVQDGLCDFPSLINGREVLLCWKLGEPHVQYWHEIDAGFAGRQPIQNLEGFSDQDRRDHSS